MSQLGTHYPAKECVPTWDTFLMQNPGNSTKTRVFGTILVQSLKGCDLYKTENLMCFACMLSAAFRRVPGAGAAAGQHNCHLAEYNGSGTYSRNDWNDHSGNRAGRNTGYRSSNRPNRAAGHGAYKSTHTANRSHKAEQAGADDPQAYRACPHRTYSPRDCAAGTAHRGNCTTYHRAGTDTAYGDRASTNRAYRMSA